MDPIKVIFTGIDIGIKVIKEVYSRCEQVAANRKDCERIKRNLKVLKQVASELGKNLQENGISDASKAVYSKFNDTIEIYKSSCDSLAKNSDIVEFIHARGHMQKIKDLESELKEACSHLGLMIGVVTIGKVESLKEMFESHVKEVTMDSGAGVYCPNGKDVTSRPREIKNLRVAPDKHGDLVVLTWKDSNCKIVDYYEVLYSGHHAKSVKKKAHKCILEKSSATFSLRLGPPKLKRGQVYEFRVRGINGAGHGSWSEGVDGRLKSGPPNQPEKPTYVLVSRTKIKLTVSRPIGEDENGSSVTYCDVQ